MNSKKFYLINMTTLFFLLFIVSACFVPGSKSSYIANFERFVKDVERNQSEFKAKDWRWANKRFDKYSGEWYEKFETEFSVEEMVKVNMLKARYMVVRTSHETGRKVEDFLKEDLNNMGKDVKEYLDKNLEKDLKEINKGAREIGDSAVKVMEDILKDIKK